MAPPALTNRTQAQSSKSSATTVQKPVDALKCQNDEKLSPRTAIPARTRITNVEQQIVQHKLSCKKGRYAIETIDLTEELDESQSSFSSGSASTTPTPNSLNSISPIFPPGSPEKELPKVASPSHTPSNKPEGNFNFEATKNSVRAAISARSQITNVEQQIGQHKHSCGQSRYAIETIDLTQEVDESQSSTSFSSGSASTTPDSNSLNSISPIFPPGSPEKELPKVASPSHTPSNKPEGDFDFEATENISGGQNQAISEDHSAQAAISARFQITDVEQQIGQHKHSCGQSRDAIETIDLTQELDETQSSTSFSSDSASTTPDSNSLNRISPISSPESPKKKLPNVASPPRTQLSEAQEDFDFEAAENILGSLSCDKLESYSYPHEQNFSTQNQAISEDHSAQAAIPVRSQLTDVEQQIGQHEIQSSSLFPSGSGSTTPNPNLLTSTSPISPPKSLKKELPKVAGHSHTQSNEPQEDFDFEASENMAGGQSCDEFKPHNNLLPSENAEDVTNAIRENVVTTMVTPANVNSMVNNVSSLSDEGNDARIPHLQKNLALPINRFECIEGTSYEFHNDHKDKHTREKMCVPENGDEALQAFNKYRPSTSSSSGSGPTTQKLNLISSLLLVGSPEDQLPSVANPSHTQLNIVQGDSDSKAAENTSGGQSCDELGSHDNTQEQNFITQNNISGGQSCHELESYNYPQNQALSEYQLARADIADRTQIADVKQRIRQHKPLCEQNRSAVETIDPNSLNSIAPILSPELLEEKLPKVASLSNTQSNIVQGHLDFEATENILEGQSCDEPELTNNTNQLQCSTQDQASSEFHSARAANPVRSQLTEQRIPQHEHLSKQSQYDIKTVSGDLNKKPNKDQHSTSSPSDFGSTSPNPNSLDSIFPLRKKELPTATSLPHTESNVAQKDSNSRVNENIPASQSCDELGSFNNPQQQQQQHQVLSQYLSAFELLGVPTYRPDIELLIRRYKRLCEQEQKNESPIRIHGEDPLAAQNPNPLISIQPEDRSCDEFESYNNPHQQRLREQNRTVSERLSTPAAIVARCQLIYVKSQICRRFPDQHVRLNEQMQERKGPIQLDGEDLTQKPQVAVNDYRDQILADSKTETVEKKDNGSKYNINGIFDGQCARTRSIMDWSLQTCNLHLESRMTFKPSTEQCNCAQSSSCAICAGQTAPTVTPKDSSPQLSPIRDVIALNESYYQPACSPMKDSSSPVHADSVSEMPDFQNRFERMKTETAEESFVIGKEKFETRSKGGKSSSVAPSTEIKLKDKLGGKKRSRSSSGSSTRSSGGNNEEEIATSGNNTITDSRILSPISSSLLHTPRPSDHDFESRSSYGVAPSTNAEDNLRTSKWPTVQTEPNYLHEDRIIEGGLEDRPDKALIKRQRRYEIKEVQKQSHHRTNSPKKNSEDPDGASSNHPPMLIESNTSLQDSTKEIGRSIIAALRKRCVSPSRYFAYRDNCERGMGNRKSIEQMEVDLVPFGKRAFPLDENVLQNMDCNMPKDYQFPRNITGQNPVKDENLLNNLEGAIDSPEMSDASEESGVSQDDPSSSSDWDAD